MTQFLRLDMGEMSSIPTDGVENLQLGTIVNALALQYNRSKGFWAILNCTDDPALDGMKGAEIDTYRLNQWDGEPYPGLSIKVGIEFIDMHLTAGSNVLVCCHAGMSRSPGMVVAYLTYKYIKSKYDNLPEAPMNFVREAYEKSMQKVRKARPIIQIHPEIDKSIRQYFRLSPRTFEDLMRR